MITRNDVSSPRDDVARADEDRKGGRIPFRLRIGVIGHVNIRESDELRAAVRKAINLAITQNGYSAEEWPATQITLTVVSALAEGADRLVAEEVLNWPASNLICVLPVYKDDIDVYRDDFKTDESKEDFERLYNRAWRRISPPPGAISRGTTKKARQEGYLWAGQAVTRNCDVLIVLWDGRPPPPDGTGGTADTLGRLRERDTRVSDAEPPVGSGPFGAAAARMFPSLETPLVFETAGPLRIIVPTEGDHEPRVDDQPPFDAAAKIVRRQLSDELTGLDKFNRKGFCPARWRQAEEQIGKDLGSNEYRNYRRLSGIFERITPPLIRADQAAIKASRWFLAFSYLVFSCTAAATIIAALQAVVFTRILQLIIFEIVFLVAGLGIIIWERAWKNHERWTAYRFLAERLRSACFLLAAGVDPETEFNVGGTGGGLGQSMWIRRAFAEVLAQQNVERPEQEEPLETLNWLIRVHWVSGQIEYFKKRSAKLMRRHKTVLALLFAVLFVTLAAAIVHLVGIWPFHSTQTDALVMCAIGLPAVASFLANMRSMREFRRHSVRYALMANVLRWYLDQFVQESTIDHLRQLAENIDHVLTEESRGWLGAVSERGLEAPG